ncbi:hypothetical protein B0H17DRAFT_1015931 [Mycena rosella]|uniref:Uncharacterized protein n=1 Tax=Mycena rosella TaxID=1033263 RepID=A0AAD7D3W3_MYCRO|nr:hypothetical protein B0H17DRAFT_1015931 [Mycena rosella]
MSKTLTNYILPLALFPALSVLAFRTIFGHFLASGLALTLKQQCPPIPTSENAYQLVYTGVPVVDKRLCGLVTLFHLALSSETSPFLNYFFGTALPLLAIPALESFRRGRHFLLALPVVFGLIMQLMTVGAILPIYWLIFITTGSARRRAAKEKSEISQTHAEGVIVGLAVGAGIPSVCLSLLQDPYVTAVWQFFPLLQFLAQTGHLLVRRPNANSGYSSIRALYIGIFLLSAATHIGSLLATNNIGDIKALLIPSLAPLTDAQPNFQVRDFLQWDAVFAFGSTLLASLWFAKNAIEVIYIVLWNSIASVAVGPGAAIAAVALWRESQLHAFADEKPKSQ